MTTKKTLSDEQIEQFHRDGFLLVRGMYSAQEVEAISQWTDEVASAPEVPGKYMMYFEESQDDGSRILCRIENFVPYHDGFSTLITARRMQQAAVLEGPLEQLREVEQARATLLASQDETRVSTENILLQSEVTQEQQELMQQRIAEKQICDMWSTNQRGEEMESVLAEYVVREVRLRSIGGTNQTGTLLSSVMKGGKSKYETPQELAQALVLEQLRRKGIHNTPGYFVKGRYLIKNADIDVAEVEEK